MTTINLTKDNFDQTLADGAMVVVDFWAPWCGPCRFFSPVFEAASETNVDVVFGKVNTDEQPELAGMFGIRSIPTLMIVRDKVVLYQEAGSMPAGPFQELLDKAKALDMVEVHRAIAEKGEGGGLTAPGSSTRHSSMSVLQLNEGSFRSTVESTPTLVVEFAVGAAVPDAVHPLAKAFPETTFARVDSTREPAVAAMFGLDAGPALLIFRDRIVLYREPGQHTVERLAGLLEQVCALDMDQVRAALDEEKRAEVALRMRRVCPTARRGPLGPQGGA